MIKADPSLSFIWVYVCGYSSLTIRSLSVNSLSHNEKVADVMAGKEGAQAHRRALEKNI